jgi:hypothetical protein
LKELEPLLCDSKEARDPVASLAEELWVLLFAYLFATRIYQSTKENSVLQPLSFISFEVAPADQYLFRIPEAPAPCNLFAQTVATISRFPLSDDLRALR